MPKLLIVTYHFPPSAASGAFRLLGFAQHLPKYGWDTIVVAPPGLPWEPRDESLAKRVPKETVVISTPYPSGAPKLLRWFAPYAVWVPFARRAARRAVKEHKPDVVLTSGPPHWVHLVGRYLQKRFSLPWIADFRDPWITETFMSILSGMQKRIELGYERRTMRKANLILHNAPNACARLQAAYPREASRMTYLTNGYDPECFPSVGQAFQPDTQDTVRRASAGTQPEPLAGASGWDGHKSQAGKPDLPVRIVHAGQLYVGRDPRPILDAVAAIGSEVPPFQFEFFGRTEYEKGADLSADARQRGIESRIVCKGQVSYQQTLLEMCKADVLLLMDTPGRKVGVPAKLYEYLGAGRPVLATGESDGDLAAVLKLSGVPYRLVPPNDVGAIRAGISELVQGVATKTLPPISDETRRKFSREALAGQLAKMLDNLRGMPITEEGE